MIKAVFEIFRLLKSIRDLTFDKERLEQAVSTYENWVRGYQRDIDEIKRR